jgi:lysylphosphatidylglycerol synthetase-like protein (DUF2156 family)
MLRGRLALLGRTPATLAFVVALWMLGALTGSLPAGASAALRDHVGASVKGLDAGRIHILLSSALWSANLPGYLGTTILVLLVGGAVERRWGTRTLIAVALVTQALGMAVGLLAVQIAMWLGGSWSAALATSSAVSPSTVVAGVVMAYSASASVLWRRRIRLGVLVVLATLVLYGGLLEDVLGLSVALVGLLVGTIVVGRPPVRAVARSSRHETRTLVSVLLAATAAGPVLAAFSSTAVGPLSVLQYLFTSPDVAPSTVASVCADQAKAETCIDLVQQLRTDGVGPAVLSVLPAVLVLVIAVGLRRGRRFAWLAAVALHVLLAGFGLLVAVVALRMPGENLGALALNGTRGALGVLGPLVEPAMVLLVLLATRRAFDISAPSGTYLRVGKAIGMALAGAFVVYVGLGFALASQFDPAPTVVQLALDFPVRLVPAGYLGLVEPAFVPTTPVTTVLFEWTGIVLWSAAIGWVLRSYLRATTLESSADARAARRILMRHGDTALSYLTMWRGNSYWFTPSGQSYVAYRVRGGVAITTADPIGPTYERETTVRGFIEFCRAHGWIPCWYSVTAQVRDTTAALGWASVQVAEETVMRLGSLAFTGRRFQDVRTALNRAEKVGITAEWVSYPETPHVFTDQIETISEEWVSDKGMPEMGFTLGGLDELDDPAVRCLLAIDADRTVHGITSWLPVHRDGKPIGWTLDFMRRRSSGFNGVMEFLIGSAALRFQAEGAEFVSLSGAPLARTDDATASSGLQRLLDMMGRTLEPVYGFRSLLAFKAKFQPTYQPLYMAYPEAAALPRIGNAVSRAYLPHLTLRQGLRIMSRL